MNERPDQLHMAVEAARTLRGEIAKLIVADKVEAGEIGPEDAQTIQDTFDGETTLEIELARAIEAEDDDTILVTGITTRINELTNRRDRIKKRIAARRGLIEQAMTVAEWPKHETPLGTLSMAKSPDTVEVDDEALIPSQFWKPADPVLDRKGLGDSLKTFHKSVQHASGIKDVGERASALLDLARLLPRQHQDIVTKAQGINDHAERADALASILNRCSPVQGAHLDLGGKHLVIRRK